MPITFKEAVTSRGFVRRADGGTLTRRYCVFGSTDEVAIYSAALSETPTTFDGFIRSAIGPWEPMGGDFSMLTVEYASGNAASGGNAEVPAGEAPADGPPPSGSLGEDQPMPASISFSTTGGTAHITQSLQTMASVQSAALGGGAGPATHNAIGLTNDGVAGCDVITAKMEFRWQHQLPFVTFRKMRDLMRLTAKTNKLKWKGFDPGELLYLGAEGQSGLSLWTLTHGFAFNENLAAGNADLVISRIGGVADITLPEKRGWDYVWVAYRPTITGVELFPLPRAAYVERVYREANFTDIGLGS